MILKKSVSLLVLLASLGSCKSTSQSQLSHDFGRFSNSRNSSQWLVADDSMLQKSEMLSGDLVFLPESEPISIRLQAWADEMRKIMIETDPQIAAVPRPLIRIINRSGANGFAMPGQVCVDLPIFKAANAEKSGLYLMDSPFGVVSTDVPENCFQHQGTAEEKLAFAEATFAHHTQCKIVKKNGSFSLSDDCPVGERGAIDGVTATAYANRLYIFSGTMEKKEDELVGTIAHELGHYYMAHSRVLPGTYGYFYDEKNLNNGKPIPLAPSDPRRQLGEDLLKFRDVSPKIIEGEIYENHVTRAFLDALKDQSFTIESCKEQTDCRKQCSELTNALSPDVEMYSLLSASTEEDRVKYLALQKSLKDCFSLIPAAEYVNSINDNLSNSVSYTDTPQLEISGKASLYDFLKQADKTIRTFVTNARARFVKAEAEFKKNPLGYYTHEQEADDFSTEISMRLGFDGYNQANSQLSNMDPVERARCKEKLAAGFKVPESILDYQNNHHELCYRVFNIHREISKIHAEQATSLKKRAIPKLPPNMTWGEMVQKMHKTLGTTASNQ